jgi:hypothetical protein
MACPSGKPLRTCEAIRETRNFADFAKQRYCYLPTTRVRAVRLSNMNKIQETNGKVLSAAEES